MALRELHCQGTDNKSFKWTYEDKSISEDEIILIIRSSTKDLRDAGESSKKPHLEISRVELQTRSPIENRDPRDGNTSQ